MLDPKTKQIKEWVLPTPWTQPYDVVLDKNGEAWTGSMMSDRVSRLDPSTGQFVEYQLPKTTNIRRVFVDNSTTPVTFWTRIEPWRIDRQGRAAGLGEPIFGAANQVRVGAP